MRYTALVLLIVLIFSISAVQKNASGETEWKIYKSNYEGQVYKIPYKIVNGEVKEIIPNPDFESMIVLIETVQSKDGLLEIVIPRVLVNANIEGQDDEFIILIDGGEKWEYEEVIISPLFRAISLALPAGSEEIEIIDISIGIGRPLPRPTIHVATDKSNYEVGERIIVFGSTGAALRTGVNIEILNPEGEHYRTLHASPNINGQFAASLVVSGEHALNGTYTAKAIHGKQSTTSTFVVPEFPMSMIIFATAVSLIFVTRLIPNLKIGSSTHQLNQT